MSYVSVGFTFKNKVKLVFNVPTAAHLATSTYIEINLSVGMFIGSFVMKT